MAFFNNVFADNTEESSKVNLVITFNVKETSVEAFQELLDSVKADLPNVEGFNSIQVYHSLANPTVFTLVENWESASYHQEHVDNLVESGVWNQVAEMLEKDPDSDYFKKI